ncbi:pepsin/retropepsin-like aspartic protease family protein [Dinghuibacter silviterrae]|uniref:hypothetical protein n=1 Tax=Dinghuibacter silviterrae TaxID=1539049 RepID=UPI0010635E78|nr:hypothetical protein [Dinghuibacter silviterrae]
MERIEQELRFKHKIYNSGSSSYYMTYIDGIVINPQANLKTYTPQEFIVDTGAAITILNRRLSLLFTSQTPIIDYVTIQYGGNSVKLPVYQVIIKIKGIEFNVPAAYDKNMSLTSLLGHFGFLNNFEHFGISKKRKRFTLIR